MLWLWLTQRPYWSRFKRVGLVLGAAAGVVGDNETPADEVEVTLCLMQERTAAIAVSEAPKESKWIWLPKLATEKGLI